MSDKETDIEPDISLTSDDGEPINLMEPMVISKDHEGQKHLSDLATALLEESVTLTHSLPAGLRKPVAEFMRLMNCYYSNLIEGHHTYPIDIEKAYTRDYSNDPKNRDLQIEARAHIIVQEWLDNANLGRQIISADSICEIHRQFCNHLPENMLIVEAPNTDKKYHVIGGEFRTSAVSVGRHIPISAGAIPRFMSRFEEAYKNLSRNDYIIAIAAAHHRFAWIHPFLDGNGRVARLISHAMLFDSVDSAGLWSVSRGLARKESRYKKHLEACDASRQGDLDGRGSLSQKALVNFTEFFLESCLDQVRFMANIIQPDKLRRRIIAWAEEEVREGNLPPQACSIYEAILYRGELPRSEVPALIGVGDKQSSRITKALQKHGTIASDSNRAPWRLNISVKNAERWLPGALPE